MVGEFPELQGTMGRYYALNDGESPAVANAIGQHYRPRFAGDDLPDDRTGCILSIADKMESIVGMFGVNQRPTGDKDPFALRRSALGVVRMLVEEKLEISLLSLTDLAIGEMPAQAKSDWADITHFVLDRARSYFLEKGHAPKAIEAVLGPFGITSPLHILEGCIACATEISSTEEGRVLSEANKRITNILKKSGFEVPFGLQPDQMMERPNQQLLEPGAETDFWEALLRIGGESVALKKQQRFEESLRVLCELAAPAKRFFDEVLVNADDPSVRDNRITLLQHARAYMNQVADLSLMAS
jgi:glycyl-tRNA synthetase beta chain